MIINKVFDEIFSTWSNVAVLRVLSKYIVGISGREIARLSGMSAKNSLRTLTTLENLGLVDRARGGRDHLFTLNRNNYLVEEGITYLFNVENKYIDSIFADIKSKLRKKCNSVFLFGSVARHEENVKSDLDLCVIFDTQGQRKSLEDAVIELQSHLRKKYSVNMAPFYITKAQFEFRAKQNKPPVADIIKDGKLIFGNSIEVLTNGNRIKENKR